jgi:tetratricopeptide (TPR) repeat protein
MGERMRHFGLFVAACGFAAPALASPGGPAGGGVEVAKAQLIQAAEAMDAKDCPRALGLARPIADSPNTAGLDENDALLAYQVTARCAFQTGDHERAYADIRRATAIAAASDDLWFERLDFDALGKRWDPVVETIEEMHARRPAALNAVNQRALDYIRTELRRAERKDLTIRLVHVLASDDYLPTEFLVSTDSYRRDYAVYLAEGGRKDEARAMVARLTSPWTVARASLDPRLRAFYPADPDIRALVERRLADRRQKMEEHPERLEAVIEVADNLKLLGRPREALEVLQSVAGRVGDPDAFVDAEVQLPWWWDELSRVYAILGRFDESMDAMRKGGALDENGGANVSQTINLAHRQVRAGRSKDALVTLAAFDTAKHDVSPYGQIALRSARACAYAFTGQREAALKDVEYIRTHQLDAPGSLGSVLGCVGDLDGAAAALIKRLEDLDQRASELLTLSDYDTPPVALPDDPYETVVKALRARSDVQAAIVRAGGTRRFHIQNP